MEEKNKSNKGLIVTIIVLLVALTGVGVYLLCDRIIFDDSKTPSNNNTGSNTIVPIKPNNMDSYHLCIGKSDTYAAIYIIKANVQVAI